MVFNELRRFDSAPRLHFQLNLIADSTVIAKGAVAMNGKQ
jgi:hypothetical protein